MTAAPTLELEIAKLRRRTREERERQAAEFYAGWKDVVKDAASKGFWRCQFRQNVPVTFHNTNAAVKVTQAMGAMGLKVAWVPRHFDKGDPANPFGQPIWIKELRVWWHGGRETWERRDGLAFQVLHWEGIAPDEVAVPVVLP